MKSAIKLLLILCLFFIGLYFFVQQQEYSSRQVANLPWIINAESNQETQVFGVSIGKNTLSEMTPVLGKLPELAVFENKTGQRTLEAYFSRLKIDLLTANVVAVLDIDDDQTNLATFADFEKSGKPMPSGLRKYDLSFEGMKAVGLLTVWKLVYMPVADYSEQQLVKFFGEPEKKTPLSDQNMYWHYPSKALLIAYNHEGKEIFYYTTKDNYARLVTQLLTVAE